MIADWVRQTCLALPHTTESVQWGNNLVFKIGGKIYAVAPLDAGGLSLSLKCSPETFAELTEREGVIPAGDVDEVGHVLWATLHGAVALLITYKADQFPYKPVSPKFLEHVMDTTLAGLRAAAPAPPATIH